MNTILPRGLSSGRGEARPCPCSTLSRVAGSASDENRGAAHIEE